jgi:hypothetical protein
MRKANRTRIILFCLGIILTLMFLLVVYAPGWAEPSSMERSTVPTATFPPSGFLPIVVR